ncbi:hypothetical protein [Nocardioides zeae]|uniref:Na+/melibiose symporter-like transporter n=1 Tax=Nocardioides zeae TaxID=1457234 RepID=A0AAJ1X1U8_9ACTN|nr:hypothetical protein [Nocardioides zeae]MDQ1105953.1 Na+/melibiose symporter-like transporter [Nocardioides zeae]
MSRPEERTALTPGKMLANGAICLVAAAVMTVLAFRGADDARPFGIVAAVLALLLGAGSLLAAARIRYARRHPDSVSARRVAEVERLTPPKRPGRERAKDLGLTTVLIVVLVVQRLEPVPVPVRIALVVVTPVLMVVIGVRLFRRFRSEHRWRRDRMAD